MFMKSEISLLQKDDLEQFAQVIVHAYPMPYQNSIDDCIHWIRDSLKNDAASIKYYKAVKNGTIVGGMRFFDFQMNMRNVMIAAAGMGLVAVNPLYRKEHVAKDMLHFFIEENDRIGYPMLVLYPFQIGFYKKMGFGYGTKQRMYKLLPTSFPEGPRGQLLFLNGQDAASVSACYEKHVANTHGTTRQSQVNFEKMLKNFHLKAVGVKSNGRLEGFIIFSYKRVKPDLVYENDMHVHWLVYNNREALTALFGYIHAQKDQIKRVYLNTQDEYFFSLLEDPTNGESDAFNSEKLECYTTALGMMYRVINIPGLFRAYKAQRFGAESLTMKMTIRDSFFQRNNTSTTIRFDAGYAEVLDDLKKYDVEIAMDVSDFSSLFVGAVPFEKLLQFGLAEISDPAYADVVSRTLNYPKKPMCYVYF
jgi:predicted acetyltransferase